MSRQYLHRACKKGAPKPPKNESTDLFKPSKSDFDKVVKNVALENEKCNYNSKIDMNWCNLPPKLRYECVKRMDFKTRCGFRGVSKTEKSLVDSEKYKFELLIINFVWEDAGRWIGWEIKSGNKELEIHIRTKKCLNEKCLSSIFKYAEVKNFRLDAEDNPECNVLLKQLAQFAPFPFKRVSVYDNRSIDFFMQTCPNLEKVDVYRQLPYNEMLKLPSLMKIKEFKIRCVSSSDLQNFSNGIIQNWIDNDAELGKSVQCLQGVSWNVELETKRLGNTLAEMFADRIIEKTDKDVRIRMNNPTTQILMRFPGPGGDRNNYSLEIFSLKVVPIDLPKSEYGKEYEWVQAIHEHFLKSARKLWWKTEPMEYDPEDRKIWGNNFF